MGISKRGSQGSILHTKLIDLNCEVNLPELPKQYQQKIALFIDAENAPGNQINTVFTELTTLGAITVRRAYGNWRSANLNTWVQKLHECAIQPVQQFNLTKGKNAADIALVISVMDTIRDKDTDIIALVSSDCDFTPLVIRVLEEGKQVIGFGERKTPEPFMNSCSRFILFDEPTPNYEFDFNLPTHPIVNIISDTQLIRFLTDAVEAANDEQGGWSKLEAVGTYITNHASFDQRNYGFKKLNELFKAIDCFEVITTGTTVLVRQRS